MFPFDPPEKIRKPLVFLCFQGDQKGTLGSKGLRSTKPKKTSLKTYRLLNKNLNFVPTPKQYRQKQLDTNTENFFRLVKLRGHFKDANEAQTSDQLYQPFKAKNKTKWTPKETHHTLKTFINLVQHDINEIKIKK